eukprot:COSAG06_NODE_18040_length_907_cov_1.342822_1_plen_157_part_00
MLEIRNTVYTSGQYYQSRRFDISILFPYLSTHNFYCSGICDPILYCSPVSCHDFLVILAMPTTSAHGTSVAIPLYSPYHTAITFEPLCSHIKPEGLTSSPLRGPTQWLVYSGPQWFRSYTTSPLRGPTRMLDAHPCSRARGFGRGTMSLVAHYPRV